MSAIIEEAVIKRLKIGSTDIILENLGPGRGKIIISDPYSGNFSYFWGSMSGTIEEFLTGLDFGYFKGCVNAEDRGVFDGKLTVRNIRRTIRDDYSYELPWYNHLGAQKELREALKELENCENEYEFVDRASSFAKNLDLFDIENKYERDDFRNSVSNVFDECWNYIEKGPSRQTIFLKKLFPKLQKALKKHLNK